MELATAFSDCINGGLPLPENTLIRGNCAAFGVAAMAYVRSLPEDLSVVACDGEHAELALAETVRRRRAGIPTLVAPLLADNRSIIARITAPKLLVQFSTADERRSVFEALEHGSLAVAGMNVYDRSYYQPAVLRTMREISVMGDALLVRSQTERNSIESMFQARRPYAAIVPGLDTRVPLCAPDADADRILVWAPDETAESLALIAFALWELRRPSVFVCRGTLADSPHEYVDPALAATALRKAAVIVDASIADPGTAIAFAGRGYGIVCADTSGAHEFIQGAYTYSPARFSTLFAAVSRARGDRRATLVPRATDEQMMRAALTAAETKVTGELPLVSIIVPTLNRPAHIRKNLEAFARQSYHNFEVVVVNDGGESVEHIVNEFPFARYLESPVNLGVVKACNFGLREARGTYLGLLADDDVEYPDHIASLVAALKASHLPVAHTNVVVSLHTRLADGRNAVYGNYVRYSGSHDPIEAHWAMPIHAAGYLVHRDVYAKIGYLSEHLRCNSDHDLTLKLSRECDFAHVPIVTAEMEYRDDKSNASARAGDSLADEVNLVLNTHLPPNRPLIKQRIDEAVATVAAVAKQPTAYNPWIRFAVPVPTE